MSYNPAVGQAENQTERGTLHRSRDSYPVSQLDKQTVVLRRYKSSEILVGLERVLTSLTEFLESRDLISVSH